MKCSICEKVMTPAESEASMACKTCKDRMIQRSCDAYEESIATTILYLMSFGTPPQRGNNCTDNSAYFALRYLGHSGPTIEKEFKHSFRVSKMPSDTTMRLRQYLGAPVQVAPISNADLARQVNEMTEIVIALDATAKHAFPIFKIANKLFAYNEKAVQFSSSIAPLSDTFLSTSQATLLKYTKR